MKLIFVSGGVISGLGKGITASSIGLLLKSRGISVTSIKIDPYLNIDTGTMNPFEHGEVYVLDDGSEVDLDLGNYERFMDLHLGRDNNITTGKVYRTVIDNERRGEYLGKTVQIIPHITDEIKRRITAVARSSGADVAIVELGAPSGTSSRCPSSRPPGSSGGTSAGRRTCCSSTPPSSPSWGPSGKRRASPPSIPSAT